MEKSDKRKKKIHGGEQNNKKSAHKVMRKTSNVGNNKYKGMKNKAKIVVSKAMRESKSCPNPIFRQIK